MQGHRDRLGKQKHCGSTCTKYSRYGDTGGNNEQITNHKEEVKVKGKQNKSVNTIKTGTHFDT